ncbi:glycoprotein [Rockport virus]|uniref:Envelopment polyprotein n=1 Tax=Rockport virus TaxID=1001080 RepID=G0WJH7_9VIRU|nr:glycoprotein [Rockport virus]AEA11485.1 glycoprotein [Rockport virus]
MYTLYLLLYFYQVIIISSRNLIELKLQCPHASHAQHNFVVGYTELVPVSITKVTSMSVDSSCNFDLQQNPNVIQKVTKWTWAKKSSTTGQTNADSTTYQSETTEASLKGICANLILDIHNHISKKTIACYDLSCNQTHCQPTLYVISPNSVCMDVRNCIIGVGDQKIMVVFEKTYCITGLLIEGICFNPLQTLLTGYASQSYSVITVPVTCFLHPKKTNSNPMKLATELEKLRGKTDCSTNNFQGYYICFLGGYSEPLLLPKSEDHRSAEILSKIVIHYHGEDHDIKSYEFSSFRIIGSLTGKVPHTESSDNVQGISYSGPPLYTSLGVLAAKDTPNYVWTNGIIFNSNHSTCEKKVLPITWTGYVTLPGKIEKTSSCNIFCTLAGPGADCEAYSEMGIFNLSSTTCLINRMHRFRGAEQQIKFLCQRIDSDIVVYCNGQRKIITTKTLVIGQCIYTFTSIFSIIPSVAHSLAVELCVPGLHGWATVMLVMTFCFGWLLIPTFTFIILRFLYILTYGCSRYNSEAKFKAVLEKVKVEYQKTMGSMVCDICHYECEIAKELDSHKKSCVNGHCPYCMNATEATETALQSHFKVCKLTSRFQENLKKSLVPSEQRKGCYRTLVVFRYKSRCYVGLTWCLLLLIELIIWAASAEPVLKERGWTDTAHGVGIIPLKSDLELDFSLYSSATFTYKRQLQNPANTEEIVPFQFDVDSQVIHAEIQPLGHWMDGKLNLKTAFHCYGACAKYTYPWQTSHCFFEKDYQYETGWGCNPSDCPGVGTGCTACGIYIDKLKPVARAYRIISLSYSRKICVQLGTETTCKVISANDCLVSNNIKVCIIGTVTKFSAGDTIVFLGPFESGGIIFKQWCTTTCNFGDPGDIMSNADGIKCPEHNGSFRKKCAFATTPLCEYTGNTISGYKRMLATKDSFQSFNLTSVHDTVNSLEWIDPDSSLKDHLNLILNRDLSFQDLTDNPCKVDIVTLSVDGAWGSGIGFTLQCAVSLTECSTFMTSIKACDMAMCYGSSSVTLSRGQNTVKVTGKGGHSGSSFKCCHNEKCSEKGLIAAAPHLDRVSGVGELSSNKVFDDGAPQCGIKCWFVKSGEWLYGILNGNWIVFLVLFVILLLSLFLFSVFCPVRKHKSN